MLQRFGQFVTVVLVSSALVPSYANAQRGAGAPMSVAVAPHMMAAPIAAAPVHAGPAPAHFAAGAHAPAHPGYTNMPFPNNGFNNGFNDGFNDGNFSVPGLGFDYAHFAAVHPGAF